MSTRLPTSTGRFPNPPARAAARARVCHTHTHPSADPDVALAGALVIRRTRMPPPAHPPERVCGQLPSALGRSRTRRRAVSLRRPPRGHGAGVPLYPPAHPLANPYHHLLVHEPQPPPPARQCASPPANKMPLQDLVHIPLIMGVQGILPRSPLADSVLQCWVQPHTC